MRRRKTRARAGVAWLAWLCAMQATLCALLFGPSAAAQDPPETAKVVQLTGQVSVLRDGGDEWALNVGQTVKAGQTIVTGSDGDAQLTLPDGSVLEVFPNSRLILHANQANWRDLLDLYLGKVHFEIQHLTGGAPPLRVTSPTAVISVRGTVFDVEVNAAQETVISVENGTVSVRHRLLPGNEVFVQAGQTLDVLPTVPLTPPSKGAIGPLGTLGQVVRIVGDTWAQISGVKGSAVPHGASVPGAGGTASTGTGSSSSTSSSSKPPTTTNPSPSSGGSGSGPSTSPGTNQTAPPPGSGGSSSPPGDSIP